MFDIWNVREHTKIKRTIAAKQRKSPGIAGEAGMAENDSSLPIER